jgi:glycosyltransferase involved in cell wall biosynthesis
MTSVDSARGTGLDVVRGGRVVVLHVAESWGAEVRAAVLQFVAATPELEHHLLRGLRASDTPAGDGAGFASIGVLPAGTRAARRAIRRVAGAIAPDVVHAHAGRAGFFVRTALRTRPDRRLVYSPHCFGFERRDVSPVTRMLVRAVERSLAGNTDSFAVCSAGEARAAAALAGPRFSARHDARVIQVPPVTRIPALAMLEHRDPNRVVTVGRIGAQRDPDFYRSAVLHLRRTGRPALEARWIGDCDDVIARARLERSGIQVDGQLSRFDAHRDLGRAGVYLHTARWEGFPSAILDAIELGVPVIARDVPTFAGATATPGLRTPQALADAVEQLLSGGDDAREANLEAWQRILVANTADRQQAALRAVYAGARQPVAAGVNPMLNPEQP